MTIETFVYYRAHAEAARQVQAVVQAWQDLLTQRHPALEARLLRRPDDASAETPDTHTWMETYRWRNVEHADARDTALQALLETGAAGLMPLLAGGGRHIERFIVCERAAPA